MKSSEKNKFQREGNDHPACAADKSIKMKVENWI